VPELYHLGNDPGERWNVAAANPDVLRELTTLADAHRKNVTFGEPLIDRRIPAK
jgi:hypothetical protein